MTWLGRILVLVGLRLMSRGSGLHRVLLTLGGLWEELAVRVAASDAMQDDSQRTEFLEHVGGVGSVAIALERDHLATDDYAVDPDDVMPKYGGVR